MHAFFKKVEKKPVSSTAACRVEEPSTGSKNSTVPFPTKKQTENNGEASLSIGYSRTATRQPRSFCTWNCNGLTVRLTKHNGSEIKEFLEFVRNEKPDVITLQEVRMKSGSEKRRSEISTATKTYIEDHDAFMIFKRKLASEYKIHLTLASKKYAGQAIFIRFDVEQPQLSYNFSKSCSPQDHHEEGRVIIAEFQSILLLSCYVPNNGVNEESFQRRRCWDVTVQEFLVRQRSSNPGKPIIYQGDLNVAENNEDVSGDASWWLRQMIVPGINNEGDSGQPGFTPNERKRFKALCAAAGLVDPWVLLNGAMLDVRRRGNGSDHHQTATKSGQEEGQKCDGGGTGGIAGAVVSDFEQVNLPLFSWRGGPGRYYAKGMRIDYTLVSEHLLSLSSSFQVPVGDPTLQQQFRGIGCVENARICGFGEDRKYFFGSDHCPVLLTLRENWTEIIQQQQQQQHTTSSTAADMTTTTNGGCNKEAGKGGDIPVPVGDAKRQKIDTTRSSSNTSSNASNDPLR